MFIRRIRIENFRSIKSTEIELGQTTVLIGPNNAGKSAVLEALRIALTRRWGQRGTGFTEYDVHLCAARPDPKVGDPVLIEIDLQEIEPGEWPEDLRDELADIIQLDPLTGRSSIILRVSCSWDGGEESYVPKWEFLNTERSPLTGRAARAVNLQEFFQFLPVFYLEALRDAGEQFSTGSQFWSRLLRSVQIPEVLEKKSKRIFDLLNRKLLAADPILNDVSGHLSGISRVTATQAPGSADLRVLPLNTWDLLSKAEVIFRTDAEKPWLPLTRHGHGVQSLSVIFLLKSFIELLLPDLYRPDSTAVLALEEPETHLHPQAARSLWSHIEQLPGQKVITTHSPYFLQHVPFRDIRVVRATVAGTSVRSLPRQFTASVPHIPDLERILANSAGLLSYDRSLGQLVVHGMLPDNLFRELLIAYHNLPDRAQVHASLRACRDASQTFVPDSDLEQLETFARRVRGEIFFARGWLLVEGPSDYHLVHGVSRGLGYDLDEHGISVIDFKNNGNAVAFPLLARALGYPWVMIVDGDGAGQRYRADVAARGFSQDEIDRRVFVLPEQDIEQSLVAAGLQPELRTILSTLAVPEVNGLDGEALAEALRSEKTRYAPLLAKQCADDPALTARMPQTLQTGILTLQGLEQ